MRVSEASVALIPRPSPARGEGSKIIVKGINAFVLDSTPLLEPEM